jgi:alkaline phosphatase
MSIVEPKMTADAGINEQKYNIAMRTLKPEKTFTTISRRGFIKTTSAVLAGSALQPSFASLARHEPLSSFGIVTDLHYADVPASGSRHYKDSLAK